LDVVAEYRTDVDELSGLAARGQTVGRPDELLAVGDEATRLFRLPVGPGGPRRQPDAWDTGYPAPPDSGSNYEGVAGDATGQVVILTEFPAGIVLVDEAARAGERFAAHTRVRFDERSMRKMAHIDDNTFLQPEGAILLSDGHLLVTHEKQPAGLFELGPPHDQPLGIHPGAYLQQGERFTAPSQLVAKAWWPITGGLRDELQDVSDLATFDGRLYLLSDKSGRLARVADDAIGPDDELVVDRVWKVPGDRKAEGVVFRDDGRCYIGFDVKLRDEPEQPNLLLATLPS
jgi:hypothetical protein